MRIVLPQLNYYNGNIRKNYEIILQAIQKAKDSHADLIVFPELALCGPFPEDLLEKEEFIEESRMTMEKLALECDTIAALIGAPNLDLQNGIMYNSAYFLQGGEVRDGVHKSILSDYDVFEESRYFVAGEDNTPIYYKGQKIRILFDEYEIENIEKDDSFIILIGRTPFSIGSLDSREQMLCTSAARFHKPFIYINQTGGHTSLLFDGNSMVCNAKGQLICHLKEFEEDFAVIDIRKYAPPLQIHYTERIELMHKALVTGIRDYFRKNKFTQAVLGLSGGIDSAVVAALAAEALGPENVHGLLMPSAFSTDHSIADALELAKNIGMPHTTLPIKEIYENYIGTLSPLFHDLPFNVAEENLQARIRGTLVMAASNKFGYIALNTSNKSEAAVGYGTLYGDMCGSLAVIGDVFKTDIFKLARYINRKQTIIPENTITKAPSAELRPNQKDQDSLPDYNLLDTVLKKYIEENLSAEVIASQGYDLETTQKIIRMVNRNEYKRAQCPPILKVSKKAFGKGRKMPF